MPHIFLKPIPPLAPEHAAPAPDQAQEHKAPQQPVIPRALADLGASSNVVQLDAFTFYPSIADGRVWFVQFYVPWCRSCKRLAEQWSELADSLAASDDHNDRLIAVARCGQLPAPLPGTGSCQ